MISTICQYLSACIVLLVSLRFLRDSQVRSRNEPPFLPYWIPFLGHALRFNNSPNRLYIAAKQHTRESRPVSLTIMGKRIYVITADRDISTVYRSKSLSFGHLMYWGLETVFGITKHGLERLSYQPDGPGSSFEETQHPFYHSAMTEGHALDEFTTKFFQCLIPEIQQFDRELAQRGGSVTVNLRQWIRTIVGTAATVTMMGREFLDDQPDIVDRLWRFDVDFFRFASGLPKFLLRKDHANRDTIIAAFERTYKHRETLRPSQMWWVTEREQFMDDGGMSKHDLSIITFGVWFAVNANSSPATFWLLAHILSTPGAADRVRKETAPALRTDGTISDVDIINNAPFLRSMYTEVLRTCSSSVSNRYVLEDTTIGGYTLKKDAIVMCPIVPHHLDAEIWGADASEFVPDRFIRNTNSSLLPRGDEKQVRPFGGGVSLCPGRFFASRQVMSFVAIILHQYDIEMAPGGRLPEIDMKTPVVGMSGPMNDIRITIAKRVR